MNWTEKIRSYLYIGAVITVAGLVTVTTGMLQPLFAEDDGKQDTRVTVKQEAGKTVYWVLPGQRELSESVFGTMKSPQMTAKPEIKKAKGPVKALLKDLPILVGVPEEGRIMSEGTQYTKQPTPFSNKGKVVSGQFDVTYYDTQQTDKRGGAGDEVDAKLQFTDPAGNNYAIHVLKVIQPPIPGYETGGGVITDASHHGTTGTGTPLMPEVYTYGAFWAVGNLSVNGEVVDKKKVVHAMTTETVRDKNYHLVHQDDLPLEKKNTIAGQQHHTHLVVLPVNVTKQGPKYEPVNTAFELSNGKTQPFIHMMYEQDEIVHAPFADKID